MEHHTQSVDDHLISSLSFQPKPGASYVNDRRSVTYFPQGGNSYAPGGVKVARIMLTGDGWLDPSTVRILFKLRNCHASRELQPLVAGAHAFFRRLRLIIGGQIVEDIDHYNRVTQMFHMMVPDEKARNDSIEGFGGTSPTEPGRLAPHTTRSAMFTPFCGIFNQDKYLPIRYAPIQLELEVVSHGSDACRSHIDDKPGSQDFLIEDIQLKADVVTLDSGLDNEYAQHMNNGKTLPVFFTTYSSCVQVSTGGSDNSINISRALTRLKGVFVSLYKPPPDQRMYSETNLFWHPMGGVYADDREVRFEMQIGAKKWPEYPLETKSEAFYQLRKALGVHSRFSPSIGIQQTEYYKDKFVLAIDTGKLLGSYDSRSAFTGYNSKAGDLLTLRITNTGLAVTDRIFTLLHYDSILNVSDSGVTVLE